MADAACTPDRATADLPEVGTICYAGIPAFEVEHWLEDGHYVFRSTEFELVAGDADMATAVDRFVEGADDLWNALEEQDDLTANELELVSLLASRFRRVLHELERREQRRRARRISFSLHRQRGQRLRTWHPAGRTQAGSSHPLHA
ncbi:MAG TPA: hypothetical protein VN812_05895 [Candidatus Acidoferrales bacterium]|nr:hypothetical protein [Candidatus Acidoferrales bacterium]